VIALADDHPFPGDPWQWGWVARAMDDRGSWSNRYGYSSTASNGDFWNFLVPGVGLAPVTEFQVLISLFVLVIGPVNYMLLRRWKRLHLLVLTIPAGALAVTAVLFAYAVICDGLSVRVRARSVTRIDQRRGQSVCWARLSYYAGLAPYGGLRFSDDVLVLPYEADEEEAQNARRVVVWNQGQRLAQGWLASRTPTQYFTIASHPTRHGLVIHQEPNRDRKGAAPNATPAAESALTIENRLDAPIESLAIRTHDGKYYWATALGKGASGIARPIPEVAAAAQLLRIVKKNEPSLPPGMIQPPGRRRGLMGIFGPFPHGFWNQTSVSPGVSLMETSLSNACAVGRIAPGSYVAIVRSQPELELGTPSAREEGSFHVVLGQW